MGLFFFLFFSFSQLFNSVMPYDSHIPCLFPQLEINEDTFFLNVVTCLKKLRENSYLKLLQHYPQKK